MFVIIIYLKHQTNVVSKNDFTIFIFHKSENVFENSCNLSSEKIKSKSSKNAFICFSFLEWNYLFWKSWTCWKKWSRFDSQQTISIICFFISIICSFSLIHEYLGITALYFLVTSGWLINKCTNRQTDKQTNRQTYIEETNRQTYIKETIKCTNELAYKCR